MTHKKKRLSDEINLTPLLDVLFSILFIVMLAGTASENTMRQNYENRLAAAEGGVKKNYEAEIAELKGEYEGRIKELTGENSRLNSENARLSEELAKADELAETQNMFTENAGFVTIENVVEGGKHVLLFYRGSERKPFERLEMNNNANTIKTIVTNRISSIVQASGGYPVFVVFNCDSSIIYRKEEYVPIETGLAALQTQYKEVVYQIKEVNENGEG